VVAIAAGGEFSMALQGDGSVVAWGYSTPYESPVPAPEGFNNVVAISAGGEHCLALLDDGTAWAWGNNDYWQVSQQTAGEGSLGLSNVVAVAGGGTHSLAAFNDGSPVIARQPFNAYAYGGTTALLSIGVAGAPPLSYQWSFNGTNLPGATNATLTLPNVQPSSSGLYGWVATNALGAVTNAGSVLTVSNSAPIFVVQPANQAAPLGSNTTFSVAAVGSWPLSYQWQCDGTNIPGANQATLTLTDVAAGNLGNYRVAVSNAYGTTWSSRAALAQVRSFVVDLGGGSVPPGLGDVIAVASGRDFNLALLANGTVAAWGNGDHGQTNVPPGLDNVVAISAGYDHSLALLSNGTVAAWGYDDYGQIEVPPGLGNVVAVSAGTEFSLALQDNGTVVGWGADSGGQIDVPPGLTNVVAIAAGEPNLALLNNGTVVAWGASYTGEATVPAGLSNVAAISTGSGDSSLALLSNRTVVAWGDNTYGETNVPAGLSDVVAIAAGGGFNLALQGNGTVVAWGYETNVPAGLSNVVAIAAGTYDALAIVTVGSAVAGNPLALGSGKFLAGRQFQFAVTGGTTGQGYTVLASTNLLNWITLTSGSITNSPFYYSDPAATNYPRRFYRLTAP